MKSHFCKLVFIILLSFFIYSFGQDVKAETLFSEIPTAKNVLCVYNSNSDISKQICDYYVDHRNGADHSLNELGINIPESSFDKCCGYKREYMSDIEFVKNVAGPIYDFINKSKIKITHLALSKDIPIRIYSSKNKEMDVSGSFLLSFNSNINTRISDFYDNPSLNDSCAKSAQHFNPDLCQSDEKGLKLRLAVSYLNGFVFGDNFNDIKNMIDKAVAPAADLSKAEWLLDFGISGMSGILSFDESATKSNLIDLGVNRENILIDKSDKTPLIFNEPIVAYGGLGTHHDDNYYGGPEWLTAKNSVQGPVANRAVIDVYESFFGVTSEAGWSPSGQARIAESFRPNAFNGSNYSRSFSGGVGTVSEPGVAGLVKFSTFFPAYASGKTLAESLLVDILNHNKAIALGDPLMVIGDTSVLKPVDTAFTKPCFVGQLAENTYSINVVLPAPKVGTANCLDKTNFVGNITNLIKDSARVVKKYFIQNGPVEKVDSFAVIDWGDGTIERKNFLAELSGDHLVANNTFSHDYKKFGNYVASIRVEDQYGRESESLATFGLVVNPKIKILQPSANQIFDFGNQSGVINISWSSTYIDPKDSLTLELISLDGLTSVINSSIPNSGLYSWIIPKDFPEGQYMIQMYLNYQENNLKYKKIFKTVSSTKSPAFTISRQGSGISNNLTKKDVSLRVYSDEGMSKPIIYNNEKIQTLGKFRVVAKGDRVTVHGLSIHAGNIYRDAWGADHGDYYLKGVFLENSFGFKVAGPVNVGINGSTDIIFNDDITFDIGDNEYRLRGILNPVLWVGPVKFSLITSPAILRAKTTNGVDIPKPSTWLNPTDTTGQIVTDISPTSLTVTNVEVVEYKSRIQSIRANSAVDNQQKTTSTSNTVKNIYTSPNNQSPSPAYSPQNSSSAANKEVQINTFRPLPTITYSPSPSPFPSPSFSPKVSPGSVSKIISSLSTTTATSTQLRTVTPTPTPTPKFTPSVSPKM